MDKWYCFRHNYLFLIYHLYLLKQAADIGRDCMAGFIYVLSNDAFPNLLKIGKSSKDPTTDRIQELNSTGVPTPFNCEYYIFSENFNEIELAVHKRLSDLRYNPNREFFRISILDAVEVIRDVSQQNDGVLFEKEFYIPSSNIDEDSSTAVPDLSTEAPLELSNVEKKIPSPKADFFDAILTLFFVLSAGLSFQDLSFLPIALPIAFFWIYRCISIFRKSEDSK